MEILLAAFGFLALIIGVASIVCWVMVIVAAFKNEQSPLLGILCILLCALGAFIIGWVKHGEWRIKNLMLLWSGLIVVGLILQVIGGLMAAGMARGMPPALAPMAQ